MRQDWTTISPIVKGTLAAFVVGCVAAGPIQADLYQYLVPTVEWLVDNSDVIAVVRDSKDGKKSPPNVLRTLKGAPATIKWPPKKVDYGPQVYLPPDDGTVRLIFVQGTSKLLCVVKLGRVLPKRQEIRDRYYGTTEHGRLLLTESELYEAIDARLKSEPSPPVARRPEALHHRVSGVIAPSSYPLESEDLTYVLIVSFTVARRDHYIEKLRTGTAAERTHAIKELYQLHDPVAEQAIREAVNCKDVTPTFEYSGRLRAPVAISTEDIHRRAERALLWPAR